MDESTDDLIERTIRTEFNECSVVTDLNTNRDYDVIVGLNVGLELIN